MGNIKSLERGANGNPIIYSYEENNRSNKLSNVSGGLTGGFVYDINGNLTEDGTKNGTAYLSYNHLNLPIAISGSISALYTYDASGKKLNSAQGGMTRDYIDGIHYLNGLLNFITTEEGKAVRIGTTDTYRYEYNLKDHLGNVRVSIDDQGNNIARVIQEDEYYALGMANPNGYFFGDKNTYLYNGKEFQQVAGDYDYGARFYNPVIGRWTVVDPAADYAFEHSPYSFAYNDPISFIDDDGEMPGPVGFFIGAFADYIGQVGNNYFFKNMSIGPAMTDDINLWSVGISGALGAATGGIDALKSTLTSGVGKEIFKRLIDYGVDVLANTMKNVASDQLQNGDFDFWKSLTGGLVEALPIKFVDKLQSKLMRKMNFQRSKMLNAQNRLLRTGLSQTRRQTAKRNYAQANKLFLRYSDAYIGVKTVADAFKSGGTAALTDDLFLKTPAKGTTSISVDEISKGEIIK